MLRLERWSGALDSVPTIGSTWDNAHSETDPGVQLQVSPPGNAILPPYES
jgi:hypothetical protein